MSDRVPCRRRRGWGVIFCGPVPDRDDPAHVYDYDCCCGCYYSHTACLFFVGRHSCCCVLGVLCCAAVCIVIVVDWQYEYGTYRYVVMYILVLPGTLLERLVLGGEHPSWLVIGCIFPLKRLSVSPPIQRSSVSTTRNNGTVRWARRARSERSIDGGNEYRSIGANAE